MAKRFYNWHSALCIIWLLGISFWASAQTSAPFNNEWINFDQTYYKIKVAKTGLHQEIEEMPASGGVDAPEPPKGLVSSKTVWASATSGLAGAGMAVDSSATMSAVGKLQISGVTTMRNRPMPGPDDPIRSSSP